MAHDRSLGGSAGDLGGGSSRDLNSGPPGTDDGNRDGGESRLGTGRRDANKDRNFLGRGRRRFTPAELAAEAARRELLRLLSSQGTGATILAAAPPTGPAIFGG